ncbi:hypothetical protein C882_1631 [Caenispirillum salinarum AK4]|uniref:Membrane protein 6-pyruvoyl-tetrahydropterin synthase-related domain-containing protein n=2 Tax=Caenispirillum TaxID=414051 RepID=K9HR86_9PROT|nr:hypothetical protein C882_1631 [Caenispirillum salinarum AK4]
MGDLYPRWLINGNAGLGSPALYFYGIFPVVVAAGIGLLLDALNLAATPLHGLGATATVFTLVGFFGMNRLLRRFIGPASAMIGGLVFALHPFALFFDLLQRFGFAEHATMMMAPWLILLILRVIDRQRHGVALLALVTAAMIASHLPSAAICAATIGPAALLFCMRQPRSLRLVSVGRLVLAGILGVALASPYLSTVATQTGWINVNALVDQPYFDYSVNFAFTGSNGTPQELTAWAVLPSLLVIVGGAGLAFAARRRLGPPMRDLLLLALPVAGVSLFFMTAVSTPVWEWVEPLQTIQFPWRFTVALTVATGLMAGALAHITTATPRPLFLVAAIGIVIGSGILTSTAVKRAVWLHASVLSEGAAAIPVPEAVRLRQDVPEYRPIWAGAHSLTEDELKRHASAPRPPVVVDEGVADAGQATWAADRITFAGTAAEPSCMVLHHLFYPTWVLARDTSVAGVRFGPAADGRMRVCVPAGPFDVSIVRRLTPVERGAFVLAAGAAALLVIGSLMTMRRRTSAASSAPPGSAMEHSGGG